MSKFPIAVSLFAAMIAVSVPAHAVVTRVGNSYFERASNDCNSGPVCTLRFTEIAAGTTVTIRAVSCNWRLGGNTILRRLSLQQLSKNGTLLAFLDHPITAAEQAGEAATITVFNDRFGMIFGPGTTPLVGFTSNSGAGQEFECTIAGTAR